MPRPLKSRRHGNNDVGIAPNYPILAGQYRDYLVRSMKSYQKGGRKTAVMAGLMGAQKPGLSLVSKRSSMMSAR